MCGALYITCIIAQQQVAITNLQESLIALNDEVHTLKATVAILCRQPEPTIDSRAPWNLETLLREVTMFASTGKSGRTTYN